MSDDVFIDILEDDFLNGPQCDEREPERFDVFEGYSEYDDPENDRDDGDVPPPEENEDDFREPELPSDQAFLDMYAPD